MIAGDDFGKLLKEVDEPYRMMIGLIATTGLRIGELLGLRWRALIWKSGRSTRASRCTRASLPAVARGKKRGSPPLAAQAWVGNLREEPRAKVGGAARI